MAPDFEHVVVDPTSENVEALCRQAVASFDEPQYRWSQTPGDERFLQRLSDEPAGQQCWQRRASHHPQTPCVSVAWWTDSIGRKHVRIVAGHLWREYSEMLEYESRPALRPTPLAHVYPDACVLKRGPLPLKWLALCGCGLFGPPAGLGWMGDCCAACHDRREEGLAPVGLCTVLKGHTARVTSLAFLPDSTGLAAADESGVWAICDVRTGRNRHPDATRRHVVRLASASGRSIFAVRWGGIDLVDPTAPPDVHPVASLGADPLLDLALSPDGQFVAVLSPERLSVYDRNSREVIGTGSANLLDGPLTFSPDSRLLAAVMGRQVTVAEVDRGRFAEPIGVPGEYVRAHAFAPDGRTLALALSGHLPRVALWDLHDRRITRSWPLLENEWVMGNRLLFHPSGRTLLATASNRLVAWDAATGELLADLAPRVPALGEIALSPDGTLVATAAGRVIRLWPIELFTGGRA
jgi:WD40 repeat protein